MSSPPRVGSAIVVGGGLIGLCCAWRLCRSGVEVTLLDAAPEAREASWAAGGMLAPHHERLGHPETCDEDLWRLGVAGLGWWADLADELAMRERIDLHLDGGLVPGEAVDLALVAALGGAPVPVPPWMHAEAASWLPGGRVDPRRALVALRAALVAAGVVLRYGVTVERIAAGRVTSSCGPDWRADAVVLAAGAWSPALAASTGLHLEGQPVKGQMLRFGAADGVMDRFVHAPGSYLIPRRGQGVVVGATMVESGFDKSEDLRAIDRLAAAARALVPALATAPVVEHWTGLRPRLADGRPQIGPVAPGLVLATGHFRNGVLLAPISAALVAGYLGCGSLPATGAPFLPQVVAPADPGS